MKKRIHQLLAWMLAAVMILSLVSPAAPVKAEPAEGIAQESTEPGEDGSVALEMTDLDPASLHVPKLGEISEEEEEKFEEREASIALPPDQTVRVSIFLKKDATLDAGYEAKGVGTNSSAIAYRDSLRAQQRSLTSKIESRLGHTLDVQWNLTLLVNAISAYVKVREIPLIEGLDGVASVEIERQYEPMAGGKADEPNTSNTSQYMVGAAAAWADGYTGAGSRIAIIDTGLDTTHQSFNADAFNHAISLLEDAPTLMTSADVTRVSSQLNGSGKYFTSKIPYGYNYVDKNSTNITHTSDTQGEHGSHVAGIAAANRFIKSGSSYNDAASSVHAVGMAPDAQLLVMKVFGSSGGAYDSDYMSAIEDAVVLGCDSANLSLGGGSPGWTYGGSYQQVLNSLTSAKNPNMVVTISAGNSGALDDELETNLYIEDVSEHTGGSPGTYINSLGVASADNIGNTGAPLTFNGSQQVFYTDSNSTGVMTGVTGSYQYVYIDAAGSASDYQTVNSAASLSGKIVLVNRGSLSFADKAKNAASYSPKGLVIVNNDKGTISMSVEGFTGSFPVVSIRMADGEQIKAGGSRHTAGSVTYYTGTVVVSSQISTGLWTSRENAEISSFSSWGVPGSLLMKPEITAPGGDIYSVYGTNKTSSGSTVGGSTKYELMSGTSMAAPHMAGLSAVTAQYLREKNLAGINSTLTGSYSQRAIIQSLLMSTATPMKPDDYLPVLQQGSGLANVAAAVRASSVIMMDEAGLTTKTGQAADGKVKFEFGDDKDKEGVYRYSFTIYNISDHDLDYTLKTDLFTQKRSGEFMDHATTGLGAANVSYQWENIGGGPVESHDVDKDGDTDNDDAQAILDYLTGARAGSELNLSAGEMDGDGVLTTKDARELIDWQPEGGSSYGAQTVPAGGKRSVEVTVRLTNAQKQFLDETYPKGAYIEGFTYVTCTTVTAEGKSYEHEHSIPILGFYGSWTTPSMFDNTSYADVANGTNTKTPYSGKTDTNYMTVSYNGRTIKLTGNPYTGEETFPEDRLAINSAARIVRVAYNLYRGAGTTGFAVSKLDENHQVTDVLAATVSSTEVDGLWYYQSQGTWQGTSTKTASVNKTVSSYGLQEGDLFRAGFYAIPEYYGLLLADDATASSAGVLTSARFQTLLQQNLLGQGALIGYDFVVDNTAPMVTGAALNSDGTITVEASDERNLAYVAVMSLDGTVKYAEAVPGTNTYSFSFDASDAVANADGYVAVFAGDYAGNEDAKAVKVNNKGTEDPYSVESVNLSAASLDLYKGGVEDLTAEVLPMTAEDRTVTWTSSKASVASVDEEGHVTAVGAGSATITVTSNSDPSKSASCQVKVTSVDKQLNAVLWDENGGVYFSRFNASGLPAWTKLHNDAKTLELHAAFMNTSSALYAGTLDMSNQSTVLYQVNRSSYALTEYGTNYVLATDMARTNSSGYFVYTFANYLVYGNVAPESYDGAMYSGLPYGMLDVSGTIGEDVYLAAVAARSIGSTSYYYLLDANGTIWQTSLNSRASFSTPTKVVETGIATSFIYQSLYYDEDYLYWSHQDGNESELIIIDPAKKTVYHAGTFGDGVWPVAGLYVNGQAAPGDAGDEVMGELTPAASREELMTPEVMARYAEEAAKFGKTVKADEETADTETSEETAEEAATEVTEEVTEEVTDAVTEEVTAKTEEETAPETEAEVSETEELPETETSEEAIAGGSLNAVRIRVSDTEPQKMTPATDAQGSVTVDYTEETAAGNGLVVVSYDPQAISYIGTDSDLAYTSVHADTQNGTVTFAFANKTELAAGTKLATFRFRAVCEDTTLEVLTKELGAQLSLNRSETVEVAGKGHAWGAVTYEWAADNSTVTASRVCANDAAHVISETVNTTSEVTKQATCEEAGETTYTAVFTNPMFASQTKTVADIPATGHSWGAPTYTWAGNNQTVMASRTCANDSSHRESETVAATYAVKTPADCENEGVGIWTSAAFKNPAFAVQTKEVVIPALGHEYGEPVYEWSADNKTATAKAVCANDASHVISETVETTAKVTKQATCEEMGETTYTAAFTNKMFTTQTKTVADIPATGHAWGEPVYTWAGNNQTVMASRTCANDSSHRESETVAASYAVKTPADCENEGVGVWTSAAFKNPAFAVQTKEVVIPALGHEYGEPVYEWSADNKTATAKAVCANDASHVISETVNTTSEVTKQAGCEEAGETTYTAVFTNPMFASQTKTVADIPATGHAWGEPVYTWAGNYQTVMASRTCANDSSHRESETVAASYTVKTPADCENEGVGVWTSAAFKNPAFAVQTKEVVIPALGHEYGEPTYEWSADNKTATAKAVCANDASHVISETVETTAKVTKQATCEAMGETTYTAAFTNKRFVTQTKTVADIPATGHAWGAPVWTWSEDFTEASAVFTCANDAAHVATVAAEVTSAEGTGEDEGMIVYTAVVTGPDGAVYTDVRKAEKPAEAEILRVYGNTRYKTGLAITEQLRREQGIEKFETVILTTGENYADALAGSYLAYRRNAPILLIRESTAALVTNYIREHVSDGGLIYVLGGEKAIPEELLAGLDAYEIKRVAGNTRYQTALEILEEAGVERGEEVIVCTGENYADSLSVSSTGKPLFLVKEKLNAAQKSMLAKLAGLGCTFTILGGEKAVTPETEALLRAEVGDALAAERIAGSTRYRTSAMIAERYFPEAKSLILVTGENYPDGLCGGPLGALLGAPVVLTTAGRQSAAAAYAAERAIHSGLVLGGQKAIDDALAREIFGVGENIEISEFFYE